MASAHEKPKPSLDEAWRQVLDAVGKQGATIGKQLKAARREYPQLVAAFQLLLGWQGLIARRSAIGWASGVALGRPGFTPWPPEPSGRPKIPDEICKLAPTLCKCFNGGDIDACIALADDGEGGGPAIPGAGDALRPVRTCQDVCADYRRALESALQYCQQYCQQAPVPRVMLRQWVQCQRDINQYWDELFERGCLQVWDYLDVVRELVAQGSRVGG